MIVEERGFVLRRNWALIGVSAIVFAFGVLLTQASGHDGPILGLLLAYFGGVCAPLFYWRNAFPHARPAVIRASASGAQLDHQPEILAEDVIEATIITRRRDAVVELAVRDQPRLVLRMPMAEASRSSISSARVARASASSRRTASASSSASCSLRC